MSAPRSAGAALFLEASRDPEARAELIGLIREALAGQPGGAPPLDLGELLTVAQTAAIRGCSDAAIYKSIARGKLLSTREGRAVRVRRADAMRGVR